MADWTALSNTAVGVGGLPSGATITALRDNPQAIAEGAAGAPRIVDGALDTTATASGQNWVDARLLDTTVLARTSTGATLGAVGSYAFLGFTTYTVDRTPGTTHAASILRYADSGGQTTGSPTPSGTWRLMGRTGASLGSSASVFLRIS